MNKLPYPSIAEDFRRQYASHSREELLRAVADLHVLQLEQMKNKARERNQWVKCSERLPEIGVPVLLRIPVCMGFNVEGGYYMGDGLWRGAWCGTHGEGKSYKVTQWAPTPEEKP